MGLYGSSLKVSSTDFGCDKELADVKKKYEKVCKENRHLEREIERLKLARL